MKNSLLLYLSLANLLLLSACHTSPPAQLETFTGTFQSVQGVMDPLSCYCSNGGYLEIPTGASISICLKEAVTVACLEIKVTGHFITRKAPNEPTTPCPPETMTVLMVREWNCL